MSSKRSGSNVGSLTSHSLVFSSQEANQERDGHLATNYISCVPVLKAGVTPYIYLWYFCGGVSRHMEGSVGAQLGIFPANNCQPFR